jgi:Uncharacterised nucleotidyltransferase
MSQAEPLFLLLALCARAQGHPTQQAQLRGMASTQSDWDALPALAEAHGLVPLLVTHLQAAGVAIPPHIRQQLLGYYMQHAHATRVRDQALAHILGCYQAAEIDVLVLKGAALAHLVYPQPLLRPMRDIDILVRPSDVYRAYALLPEIGFAPPPGAHHGLGPDHHHLTAIKRVADGFSVSVEVHHALHLNEPGHPRRYEAFAPSAQPFTMGDMTAWTLGREETLWHIYRHAFSMPIGYEPARLIWVADLISLVEAWIDVLDWERVRSQYRAAERILPLLHSLTPWSDAVLDRLKLPVAQLPTGAGANYQGWPRFPLVALRARGFGRLLRDSFFPSPWWLRIHYGQGPGRADYWRAWLAHQRMLLTQVGHVVTRDARLYRK